MTTFVEDEEETRPLEERMAIVMRICARIASGELLRDCYAQESIDSTTWWRWCESNNMIRAHFERARLAQAHSMAEYAVSLPASIRGADHHIVQAVRLETDLLRWYTSKIAPKLFGDRIEVGGEGFRIGVIALPAETTEESRSLGVQRGNALKSGSESVDEVKRDA